MTTHAAGSSDAGGGAHEDGGPKLDEGGIGEELGEGSLEQGDGEVESGDADIRFDLGALPDGPDGGGGELEFSFIWIANSPEGTVSKIDTRKRLEVARYRTGPDSPRRPDPSRTSVGLHGDVAVVNRGGGIVRIFTVPERCIDQNGNGLIETSTGPGDILPWGRDECVAWHLPMRKGSRPVAWTAGEHSHDADGNDVWENAKVWTSEPLMNVPPLPDKSDVAVYLIDGDSGVVEAEVTIPQLSTAPLGLYGGAVDSKGDFWALTMQITPWGSQLVHVPFDDLAAYRTIEIPGGSGYGITVDSRDRVWVGCYSGGSLQRYDPVDERWLEVEIPEAGADRWAIRGMMEDQAGDIWAAVAFGGVFVGQGGGLLRVGSDSGQFVEFIGEERLPGVTLPTGASVDIDGQIWLVDEEAESGGAFVYDPMNEEAGFVDGLVAPYTYSDMTGWALANVTDDPPG